MELNTLDCLEIRELTPGVLLQVMPAANGDSKVLGLIDMETHSHYKFSGGEFVPDWPQFDDQPIIAMLRFNWVVVHQDEVAATELTDAQHARLLVSCDSHTTSICIPMVKLWRSMLAGLTVTYPPLDYGKTQHVFQPYEMVDILPVCQPLNLPFRRYSGIVAVENGQVVAMLDRESLRGVKISPYEHLHLPTIDGDASITVYTYDKPVHSDELGEVADVEAVFLNAKPVNA